MLKKIFKLLKQYTETDLQYELLKPIFNIENVNQINKSNININWQNDKEEGFLHLCASKNLAQSFEWLLNNGANIELETKENLTPLFYAVHSNAKEIINSLIRHDVNVDHQNIHKRTVLQEAVISGSMDIVDLLLKYTKNINNIDEHGHNLIFDALSNGSKNLIKKIMNNKNVDINQVDKSGRTILHQSTVLGDKEIAIALMEKGADPTIQDKSGKNFLFYAAAEGIENEDIINKAIGLGCNINSRNNKNQTILMETLLAFYKLTSDAKNKRNSLLSMVKKLIDEGGDINCEDDENETALFIAVRNEDIDSVELLLKKDNININHQNIFGATVLSVASLFSMDNLDLILLLAKNGANPNIRDYEHKTVIEKLIEVAVNNKNNHGARKNRSNHRRYNDELAKEKGQCLVVLRELLKNSKVDLSLLNSKRKPLFFDSIFYQNMYLFRLLKKFGVDINQKDSEQENIIHNFMEYTNKQKGFDKKIYNDTLKVLIALGVNVNSKNQEGSTATHKAVLEEGEQTVKLLLNSKADINAVDEKGRSLIHNCVWDGKVKYFKLLHSHDENILNKADKYGILPINYAAFIGHQDLVIEMLESGAYVNNTNPKSSNMIKHLNQFNYNLNGLNKNVKCQINKKNISLLVENMKTEFML